MAKIDNALEEQMAARRANGRQDVANPYLISDDGDIYPNTPLLRRHSRMRMYYGDPAATLDDRLRYLKGLQGKRQVTYDPVDDEPFDISKADVDTLVQFAIDQYGAVLDPSKPVKTLREQVFKLSQLPATDPLTPDQLPPAQGGLGLTGA